MIFIFYAVPAANSVLNARRKKRISKIVRKQKILTFSKIEHIRKLQTPSYENF